MTFASRVAGLIRRTGGGSTATLRLRHTLANSVQGKVISALFLVGAHPAGVLSLTADAQALTGVIYKGVQFTVAGSATIYTASSRARAASGQIVITFTPALAANALDNATVTIVQPYGETTWDAAKAGESAENTEGGSGDSAARGVRLALAVGDNAGVDIPVGALCTYSGRGYRVEKASSPGLDTPAFWHVDLGEMRA